MGTESNTRQRSRSTRVNADELKRQIPDVARVACDLYGIEFTRNIAHCPFPENHNNGDRNPSLRYDKSKNRVFCASQICFGAKGVDMIGLVQKIDACSFSAAIRKLQDHYGIRNEPRRSHATKCPRGTSGAREKTSPTKPPVVAVRVRQDLALVGFRVTAEYEYGTCLRKVRFESESRLQEEKNRAEKTFRWEHCVSGVWYSGDGGMP